MASGPDMRYTTGWGRPVAADAAAIDAGLRAYMLRVYNWMASGLLVTGIVAYVIGNSPELQQMFWSVTRAANGARILEPTILGWAAMLSPLAFILVLSFGINKLSRPATQALFWVFAACMGASLSNIFLRYTGQSIATTFFITASMFAAVSLYGYTTKADLTRLAAS